MIATRPYILHVLSPLHAGVGQAAELIDLPIARMKGTGIPFVPGSSVKGVLRDAREEPIRDGKEQGRETDAAAKANIEAVFGPDYANADKHAGALICGDARLLALPVRSYRGAFAYVTSPLLLTLAGRDLDNPPRPPAVTGDKALVFGDTLKANNRIYLEDLDLDVAPGNPANEYVQWAALIASVFGPDAADQSVFKNRFVVVDDETMTFLWENATQVDQRIRIDPNTRTVAKGALWLEESLPAETLMVGLLAAETDRSRKRQEGGLIPTQVLDAALPLGDTPAVLQFGGKATVGRGRCRMIPIGAPQGGATLGGR